jgi:hypothetical protein
MHFIYPEWKGLPIIPSDAAMRELFDSKMDLIDVKEILELGYDCAKSKRKKEVLERCLERKGKSIKVVVAKGYNYSLKTDCWVVIHVKGIKR